MNEDLLILIARVLGVAGVMVLAASAVLGSLLASRTAQTLRLLKVRTFRVHRPLSVVGAGLLLAHPIPVVLARETTGAGPAPVVVPFAAEKLVLNIAFGAVALDALLIVLASSLLIKRLPRRMWRRLHYGAYAALAFGLYHGLLIPDDFGPNARHAPFDSLALDKVLVESAIVGAVLAAAWRLAASVRRRRAYTILNTNFREGVKGDVHWVSSLYGLRRVPEPQISTSRSCPDYLTAGRLMSATRPSPKWSRPRVGKIPRASLRVC